jgi:YkoY family integral membrane protein
MLEQLSPWVSENLFLNTTGILLSLVALETVLSADNAIALAALVQHLPEEKHQKQALNWGLGGAFILRITLIILGTWIVQFWQFQLAGALYLLWLTGKYFWERLSDEQEDSMIINSFNDKTTPITFDWQIIPLIAVTDLAFSLDSVTTAIALSDQTWLILIGGMIGVIALRFLAEIFVQWLNQFTYLQDAAYLTIFWVGIRLLFKALLPNYVPPEWMVLSVIIVLFFWGFSKRELSESP